MIGVKGWYSANQRRPVGIDSDGTMALPMKGRNCSGRGRLLAVSGLLATRPIAAASQVSAKVSRARTPATATHSVGVALGRKPMISATPMTSVMLASV